MQRYKSNLKHPRDFRFLFAWAHRTVPSDFTNLTYHFVDVRKMIVPQRDTSLCLR